MLPLALAVSQACATARNYADPAGPMYFHAEPSPAADRRDLQVLTYNIKFGRAVDRVIDLLLADGAVERPDLLLLQEMNAPGVERLARSLRMNSVYVPSAIHPAAGHDFGVAILSPWPLRDARKIVLPHQHRFRKMVRTAVTATVDTPLGPVRAYSVHIETPWGLPASRRRDQVAAIASDAAAWDGPVVIAGDFNGKGFARAMADAGFAWPTRDVGGTAGPFGVDHILVRGLCGDERGAAGLVTRARGISDHLPVWTRTAACP